VSQTPRSAFTLSPAAGIAIIVAGVALTVVPTGSAAIALLGLAAIWGGMFVAMKRSPAVIRRWATLMVAIGAWFALAAGSGSLALWTAGSAARGSQRGEPARVVTEGANLQAEVRFTGAQFLISNHSRQPWEDVSIKVTGQPAGNPYELHAERIAPGETMTLVPSRLLGPNGAPFNAVRTKPHQLVLSAHLGDTGLSGSYEADWN
jgi:hypothetical protein